LGQGFVLNGYIGSATYLSNLLVERLPDAKKKYRVEDLELVWVPMVHKRSDKGGPDLVVLVVERSNTYVVAIAGTNGAS
jgi:hypothetical protein